MLKLHEIGRGGDTVVVRAEGYLTWSSANLLRDTCLAYRREGLAHVDLEADQLRGVDLAALKVLDEIVDGGQRVRFLGAAGFVRALLTSWERSEWLAPCAGAATGKAAPA